MLHQDARGCTRGMVRSREGVRGCRGAGEVQWRSGRVREVIRVQGDAQVK